MRLFTYGYGHSVREVAGSCLGRGTIAGGVFHPTRQLARFSPPNMPYILNLFRISLYGEVVNYRPFASPSFDIASHVKNCHFGHYYYKPCYPKVTYTTNCVINFVFDLFR